MAVVSCDLVIVLIGGFIVLLELLDEVDVGGWGGGVEGNTDMFHIKRNLSLAIPDFKNNFPAKFGGIMSIS